MTASAVSTSRVRHGRLAAAMSATVRAFEAVAEFHRIRRNRAAILRLSECSDYMLHDIGVTRADLHSVLGGSPFDDPSERLGSLAEIRLRQAAARRIG